jgi:NAD-dependent dihydropyrimidine dehydrogenase PreA subunit
MKDDKMKDQLDEKFAKWKGIPREEIDWAPIIDRSRCVGCGMCVVSCGRNVFEYDVVENKAVVARPLQCLVGCSSCENWCVYNAISFKDPQYIKDVIVQRNVLKLVKNELKIKYKTKE